MWRIRMWNLLVYLFCTGSTGCWWPKWGRWSCQPRIIWVLLIHWKFLCGAQRVLADQLRRVILDYQNLYRLILLLMSKVQRKCPWSYGRHPIWSIPKMLQSARSLLCCLSARTAIVSQVFSMPSSHRLWIIRGVHAQLLLKMVRWLLRCVQVPSSPAKLRQSGIFVARSLDILSHFFAWVRSYFLEYVTQIFHSAMGGFVHL